MTRRITVVITAVVVVTLVLAGAGSIVVGNLRARHTTLVEVRRQATDVAANVAGVVDDETATSPALLRRTLRSLNLFRTALNVDGLAVLTALDRGLVGADQLPADLPLTLFPEADLRAGEVISGRRGNIVFAAAPTVLANGRLIVVVLFRTPASAIRAAWGTFLLASLLTLALGVAAAVVLARRLSRPIRQASAATGRIARGELSARLPEPAAHDHDDLAELARSVNQMASELDRVRVLEQQFLLSVSHDLRTPLTSIRGYADAITDGAAEPQHAAQVIRREAGRLERLVGDLLELARLRSQSFSMRMGPVDLGGLATLATEGFAPDAHERGIALAMHVQRIEVLADHDRLGQVVANLIENSLRYARSSITVSTARAGGEAVLTIDDDGPGIAPADLPHVFDRLYVARSQPTRSESSSGLGLAIVKELIGAMGGTVAAGVSATGGARFEVRLPIATGT